MAHPAGLLARVLGDIFPGKPNDRRPESPVTHAHPKTPRVVGQGAANETRITIDGVPYLFVDEGDCVVEFEPAFDEHTGETAFGLKILPELTPHWSMRAEHRCALKEAIATAIRRVGQPASENVPQAGPSTVNDAPRDDPMPPARHAPRGGRDDTQSSAPVVGRIAWWGEDRFPDRNSNGARSYTSFALRLDTAHGERTLQGEGLKDAIAECRCQVGDRVTVRRLRKIKVPAFRQDGTPKIVNGRQAMWDKWIWSISK
ncbi:hypothetical protein KDX16_14850 [Burkholderia vietnamiensis]|uniref:hypothetical protein n=1 Tax=Burkholderia vietnamiensis TaxID=60552 RepID=UPI00075371BF|nr:hypothetical protein [Burkholderia vietnamiensis]KVE15952.1 hypothetical protein WI92_08315 [Burkholderia vietnamiensis]KVR82603.1 hypothetical protein WK26_11780 [Burkholderia vietnamiensis]MBR7917105.1 hypothetical protein [Burkholderia vietnamiensis]CAG9225812.1 conserved hypothetical protein [Burkholderia vietnamiensis]HDR8964701.1 hypothetical protein [Burkholderia vietnamiensis]